MLAEDLKAYQGNCHCGAYKFTVNLPEVKSAYACNCSICSKKGYLWVYPGEGNFKVERGEECLVTYEFAQKTTAHKFCPTCGTAVIGQHASAGIGVNARTLVGVNPFNLECNRIDGAALDPPYEHRPFIGDLPTFIGDGETLKTYTGGCHCGAVSLAVNFQPLTGAKVKEDNCSICSRNGYRIIIPPKQAVRIVGKENTTGYKFGKKLVEHHFCKTCGVPVYMELDSSYGDLLPVNVNILEGIDWDDLKIHRSDQGTEGYVVP